MALVSMTVGCGSDADDGGGAAAPAPTPVAGDRYATTTLVTSLGSIELELFGDDAPNTVTNFTRYVSEGAYDGTIFHRVIPGFMAQGGGFTPELEARETYAPILNEADNGQLNLRGTVAMARTGEPHSATNQFFINVVDNDFLDFTNQSNEGWGYAVFGRVTSGMDVVDAIVAVPTGSCSARFATDCPQTPVTIETATGQ